MGADIHRGSVVMTATGILVGLVYWYDWYTGMTGILVT